MSDSELSDAPSVEVPPDSAIKASLQEEVKRAAQGPVEEYTVARIRKAAEKSLGLPEGWFKGDDNWKQRSKSIIEEQVAAESKEDKPQAKTPQKPAKPAPHEANKRTSQLESTRSRKKQKTDSDEETSALSSPPTDSESNSKPQAKAPKSSKKKAKPVTSTSKANRVSSSKDNENGADTSEDQQGPDKSQTNKDESESELSEVLDEAPAKQRRSQSKTVDTSDKKSKGSKAKPKTGTETDPDQEEIRKLQGWLVKCGIRKVWGKELKPFATSKAKIKHLKEMLTDAGMTGRYSNEKAAQIKESRELAADIEAVQEGNERWGKSGDEGDGDGDGENKTRGGRRLVRGAKNYDFLSSDGEETD